MDDIAAEPERPRRHRLRRVARLVVGLLVVVVVLAGAGVGTLMVYGSGDVDRSVRTSGQDAYWLGHAWVDGRKSQDDVDALVTQIQGTGIKDLFVHAGPYADDGTLDASLRPKAAWLIDSLHTALPDVRVQAWLGDVLADDRMNLSSEKTRRNILAGVDDVLADGFDGVHYDFEPVENDNQGLLDLLAATPGLVSVAVPQLQPLPLVQPVIDLLPAQPSRWSQDYLHQVALLVNQVAIMAYDTALPSARAYRGYVRRQTELALDAVPSETALLMGAPAYHDQKINRYDFAETMSASIAGIQLALADVSRERAFGVALYVDFDATDDDWSTFVSEWA